MEDITGLFDLCVFIVQGGLQSVAGTVSVLFQIVASLPPYHIGRINGSLLVA